MTIVIKIIQIVFNVYYVVLLLRVIFSWIRVEDNFFTRFVYEITEPILGLFRRLIPPRPSFPIDFSPIIAFVVLQLLESIIIRVLLHIL